MRKTAATSTHQAMHEADLVSDLVSLETFRSESLLVASGDPLFSAAKLLLLGHNACFIGRPGSGKSARCSALLNEKNYPLLLQGSPLAKLEVVIFWTTVDLIPMVTASEVHYEYRQQEQSGHWQKHLTGLDAFIDQYGYKDRAQFEMAEEERQAVLQTSTGRLVLHLVWLDDFDRVSEPGLLNAALRQIEDHRHELSNGEVRWLNLQALGTSNSGVGKPGRQCLGATGLDRAMADRFILFTSPTFNPEPVLNHEFPGYEPFIHRLTQLTTDVEKRLLEGEFASLGEVGMRSLRPAVKGHVLAGMNEVEAAQLLFGGLTDEQEALRAQDLVARYFGRHAARAGLFDHHPS